MPKGNKETRTRNWSIVLYPESAPENWRQIIDDEHIEWVESPLHEFDVNPTGEVKKAHWHVLLMFGGVKSYDQVVEFLQPLNCPCPQKCHNSRAMVRYMAHLDNPDKFQYSINDIIPHGGVDIGELLKPSSSERYSMLGDIQDFCMDNGISEFFDLVNICRREHFDDWYPLLTDNYAFFIGQYLKSYRHIIKEQNDDK